MSSLTLNNDIVPDNVVVGACVDVVGAVVVGSVVAASDLGVVVDEVVFGSFVVARIAVLWIINVIKLLLYIFGTKYNIKKTIAKYENKLLVINITCLLIRSTTTTTIYSVAFVNYD